MPLITSVATTFFLLGVSAALAQQITAAAKLSDRPSLLLQPRQHNDAASGSVNVFAAINSCYSSVTGCNIQLSLNSGCSAQYGTDFKQLYCLCTTGYWDAVHECDYCQVTKGVISSSEWTLETSLDDSNCASLTSQYGTSNASDITTTRTGLASATPSVTGGSSTAAATFTALNVPSSTFVITMDGSPTAAVPTLGTTPAQDIASTTSVSSASGDIRSSVIIRLLVAATCVFCLLGVDLVYVAIER
ncbi:hypothetical protein NA56DRAFT_648956 [Hyaloscypha hepaticicola]|uniref:Uncharacterized protein n=1 Tax=Hyaloscypha hepaticicola TaxID=2082293 RepID=A0A2J6PSC0_9HELO|nr:hypothetical protein NA56DRAFT_648956 [Hyaloscypha hepaticicola]